MDNEEFRRYGHQVVDWIADYLEDIRRYPVLPDMHPGDLVDRLPAHAPDHGESMDAILEDFEQSIMPALTHWNHPRFYAYFANSGSHPGILAEMLTGALNVNGMVWKSCPALTELEEVTLGWLREWLGLPAEFFGIIYDTASVSTLHAIAAAREMADPECRTRGNATSLVMYTSEQAHSSVEKAGITLGIGQDNIRKIPVDDAFRMRADVLRETVVRDLRAGKKPFCFVATVGTTSTSSIDPVEAIADVAEECGAWLHVDGAYGGTAAVVPELQSVLAGAGRADSVVVNPHKWLFTPVDLSAFYTRRPQILRQAFALVPEFLRTAEDPRAVNYMDYGVSLGRRFRALKLWFVMRHYGREGVANLIRKHIDYAQRLAGQIREHPDFEVVAPTPFSLICFRYRGSDDENRALLDAINASGKAFLSHTVLNGKFVLRLAIGNIGTEWEDLEETWNLVRQCAKGASV
ncbi:MAG TPA: pyridoxal-dependent decarboxylase, partial [Bryobacteraceae bacterium]|nr:pyridoxal-dependent decarboxylase [Bryobacteraceae bacterium]